ncbi:MAG: hypothetical protein HY928_11230, partial [Elusimicrobia bacterium]|nr:hypothetical protein [Elusimicrobiota bacterium]
MADWNTSSTKGGAFERFIQDPKKMAAALVGVGAVLLTLWGLAFKQSAPDTEATAVAFAPPDPSRALPPVGSGMLPTKPLVDAKADPEADALKTLQAEALKEAAGPADDVPAAEAAAEVPTPAEDEAGAPGRPIAEGAGFMGGSSGGGFSGSLGESGGFSGGAAGAGAAPATGAGGALTA